MKKYSKLMAILLVFAMILAGVAQAAPVVEAEEVNSNVIRLSGADRIKTSVKISQTAYKDGAESVVIVGYEGEVDALAGTLLAHAKKGPVLFTKKGKLSEDTKTEIARLGAKNVYILGGTATIEDAVKTELETLKYTVKRISGSNREGTAAAVAKEVGGKTTHVFLARGYGDLRAVLSDALAVGPASAKGNMAVLLTRTDKVPAATLKSMKDLGVTNVTIVGGEVAVNSGVKTELETLKYTVDRLSGTTREGTAIAIANKYFAGKANALVANGYGSPDALVGGYLGAAIDAPILFSQANKVSEVTTDYLKANTEKAWILGGERVVNKEVLNKVLGAVVPTPTPPSTGGGSGGGSGDKITPVLEAPADGLQQLEVEGVTADGALFLVAGLGKDGGKAQTPSTLAEVKAFIEDKYKVAFNSEHIVVTDGKIEVTGSILSQDDWNKVKADGNKKMPYRITLVRDNSVVGETGKDSGKQVAKVAMYEDGKAVVEKVELTALGAANLAVEKAEKVREQESVDAARELVDALEDSQTKTALQARIDAVQDIIDARAAALDVKTLEGFKAALENEKVEEIKITASFDTTEKILVNRAVEIDGGNNTITFTGDPKGAWNSNFVLHVYDTEGVVIKDISLTGGDAALLVNGSDVTLEGSIDVSGNEFGGIESSKGSGVTAAPSLTVTGVDFTNTSEEYGLPTIWEDGVAETVTGFKGTKITKGTQPQYYLTVGNSVDPAIGEANQAITAALVNVANVELAFGTEVNQENIVAKIPVVEGIEYTAVIKEGSTWTVTVKDTAGKGTPQTKEIEVTVAADPNAHIANVKDLAELKVALADTTKTIINITASFNTAEKIVVNRPVTINGSSKEITFTGDATDWQGNYVIQVYDTTGVTIKDIKLTGGDAALLVNGSEVTLEGSIDVSGNEFGGIESSKGSGLETSPSLTVTGVTFANTTEAYGLPTIWEDGVAETVVGFTGTKITKGTQPQYYLTVDNSVDPAIGEANQAITAALVNVANVELAFGTEVNQENIVAKLPVVEGIEYTAVNKEGSTWTVTVKDTAGKGTPQDKEIEVTVAADPNAHIANVGDLAQFKAALANEAKSIINLDAGFETTEKILVNRAVTINGNNKTIAFTGDNEGWQGNYVIQVYNTTGVTIKDIKLTGGDAALLVNGSDVTLNGAIDVSGNEFGGVEVSKGTGDGLADSKLTVTDATLANNTEAYALPTVWIDKAGGTVVGGTFTENTTVKADQVQFYLVAANSVDETKAVATTVAELQNALANEAVTDITVKGTLGTESDYTVYNVNRKVTIKGVDGAKVFGTFIIKADNVTIKDLAIQNQGDLGGNQQPSPQVRGNIVVYAKNVTLKNNTITHGLGEVDGLANAVQIFSNVKDNPLSSYVIESNSIEGFNNEARGSSSVAILIAQGYNSTIIGKEFAESITATPADYAKLLDNNTFTNNKIDLIHQDWEGGLEVLYPVAETDPVIESATVVKDDNGNLVLTVTAKDDNLYSLEVDHSHGKHGKWASANLPEFHVYADAEKVYGTSEKDFDTAGLTAAYDESTQTWTLTFKHDGQAMGVINNENLSNGAIDFFLAVYDVAGNNSKVDGKFHRVSQPENN